MSRTGTLAGLLVLVGALVAEPTHASECPSAMLYRPDASGAVVDAGWTGVAHRMPVVGYTLRMATDCAATSPPCGSCAIDGLLPNAGGNNLRCSGDTSKTCATDGDCGADAPCHFFMSPPTPIASGGITTCYTTEVIGPAGGTVDVDTGALSADIPMQILLYQGPTIDNPCPRCIGDAFLNDNFQDGTCSGGARNGFACDANATASFPDFGSTSFDCPPNPFSEISQFVLGTVTFATGTQSSTLSAATPPCSAFAFGSARCHCDTCNNGDYTPCQADADCPDPPGPIGAICGGERCLGGANHGAACTVNSECPGGGLCGVPGEPTKPHACLDDTTTFDPTCIDTSPVDGDGECALGPYGNACTVASGHPQRVCTSDADCGGDPGTCQLVARKCYLDDGSISTSIDVTGVATPPAGTTSDPTDLGALTCLAPSSSSAVNAVGGFPGLWRMLQPGKLTFAEEVVVQNVPPGGTATTAGSGVASVVETAVTTPSGGEVTIVGTFNPGSPPSGYEFLGRLVEITAPTETPGSPLVIMFHIDAFTIPAGQTAATIDIFRNGVGPIPDCLGATQAIPDDPCVSARDTVGGGDVEITVLTSTASEWTMAVPEGGGPSGPNKCAAGQEKCVAKYQACELGCHAKAEKSGDPVDPSCVAKCEDKFDGGPDPAKGCFAKLEAKYGAGCYSSGATATLQGTADAYVLDAVQQLDPGYPVPVANPCSTAKKKCVSKEASCRLGCYAKAHTKGESVDGSCLAKCEAKFSDCYVKAETKIPCLTVGDAPNLDSTGLAFVDDVVCQLHGPADGTCPP